MRWMTSKNNRAPLLGYAKLCLLFQSHQCIQTGVTVRVKISDFLSRVTLKFVDDLEKQYGTCSMLLQAFCASFRNYLWIQTGVTVWKRSNWGEICFDLCNFDLWTLTLTFCMGIASLNGNNTRKFQDDTMKWTLWKRCHRRPDRQTDRSVLRAAWSQLKIIPPAPF